MQTYKLQICKDHQRNECKECNDYLNNILMKEYNTKYTKETIDKHRNKVNKWIEDNYKTIVVVDPKELFSELNKAKDFDGTNYTIDPQDYEEIQEKYTKLESDPNG